MKTKITLVAVAFAALLCSCSQAPQKTFLFNGENLDNWICVLENGSVPVPKVYSINKDGNLQILGQPFGYMRTVDKYGDYKLHVEWRWMGEGSNSGIFQRVQNPDNVWPEAIEYQLCSGKAGDYVMLGGAKINEVECVGDFPVKDRSADAENPVGEWNTAEIICKGKTITSYVNGKLVNECTGEHTEGYIALQSEGGPIEFRNVYITEVE